MCNLAEGIEEKAMRRGMEKGKKAGIKEGIKAGKKAGIKEGMSRYLVKNICKKLRRGKSIEIIAEELEEQVETIKKIYDIAINFAPDFDEEKIMAAKRI